MKCAKIIGTSGRDFKLRVQQRLIKQAHRVIESAGGLSATEDSVRKMARIHEALTADAVLDGIIEEKKSFTISYQYNPPNILI